MDSFGQLSQAISGKYNDWHPVWHTIVAFTIPIKLFGKIELIAILQILVFSFVMGYLGYVAYKHFGIMAASISTAICILNPYISIAIMFPWKDVAFGISSLIAVILAIDLWNEHPPKIWKLVVLGSILAQATLFRHNGLLLTASILIAVFVQVDRYKSYVLIGTFVFTITLIRLIIYPALNVEYPGNRITEVSGLPMTIIGSIAKESPEKLDSELSDFIFDVAPKETWDSMTTGNFNTVKWTGINMERIEKQGMLGMVRLTFKCFALAPIESFKAFIALTDFVYGVETGTKGGIWCELAANDYGIIRDENIQITGFLSAWNSITVNSFLKYFRSYGVYILGLLVVIVSKVQCRSLYSWKKVLLTASILVYDFGTMLLLSGWDSRFFLVTFFVSPILILFMIAEEKNEVSECSTIV